jgi:DNA-binding transcriptional ArsR family regulator
MRDDAMATERVDVFRAIADPTRRQLIALLATGERPVKELAAPFAMSRPAISQHLAVLQQAGLVTERRVGRERRYALEPEPLREVRDWLATYERFWLRTLDALGRHLEAEVRADAT